MVGLATSEHPVAAHAVAECAGALLEAGDSGSDEVLCVVSTPFMGALDDITGALAALLGAGSVLGVVSRGIVMGARQALDSPSMLVITGRHPAITLAEVPPAAGSSAPEPRPVVPVPRGAALVRDRRGEDAASVEFSRFPNLEGRVRVELRREGSGGGPLVAPVEGIIDVARELVVTGVEADGILVALDELPAGELFESLVMAADDGLLEDASEVGFEDLDNGGFVAVRRSPTGLATSRPLAQGTRLAPAVRGAGWVLSQVGREVDALGGSAALVIVDERVLMARRRAAPGAPEGYGSTRVAGFTSAGIILDEPRAPVRGSPLAVVLALG